MTFGKRTNKSVERTEWSVEAAIVTAVGWVILMVTISYFIFRYTGV